MKQLYAVSGTLPKGFRGHISYTTVLPEGLSSLRILSAFDKREAAQDLEELRAGCHRALEEACGNAVVPEAYLETLYRLPKSEINVSLFLGEACAGSAHRDQTEKEILISPHGSTEGFLSCRPAGVARVVLHVLNVLNDDTQYRLEVKGAFQ